MKKCSNCGKENRDDAVLCHYCWHELPRSVIPSRPDKPKRSVNSKRSVWGTGAMWAAVITGLAVIVTLILYFHSVRAILGSLVIGSILSFLFLWLTGTLITWRWRAAGKRRTLEVVGIVAFILFWVALSVTVGIVLSPVSPLNTLPQVDHTATITSPPTFNPLADCNPWDSVTTSQVGQTVCIYGRVSESSGTLILFSRDSSLVRVIYRPIGTYLTLHNGDCITASGPVTSENGLLLLTTTEISDCPAGLNP